MSEISVAIHTQFGCLCGRCQCRACGQGRKYTVSVKNTDFVRTIWTKMAEQNPKIEGKKPCLLFENEKLDPDRRVINYELKEGSLITIFLPPYLCCDSDFRTTPSEDLEAPSQKLMDDKAKLSEEVPSS